MVSSNYLGFNVFDNASCFQRFFSLSFFSKTFLYAFLFYFFVCELMLPPIFMVTEHQCFLLYLCWFIFMLKYMYVCVCMYMYMYMCICVCIYICMCVFYNLIGIQIVTASIFGHVCFFIYISVKFDKIVFFLFFLLVSDIVQDVFNFQCEIV